MHHPRWHPVRIVVLLSISLLFTYLFIRWMYPGLNKLRFDLVRTETALDEIIDYHDLDGDGNSEKIRYISNPDLSSFLVYQGEGIVDQWNVPGLMDYEKKQYGDFDHNGMIEVYVFSYKDDTIFCNVTEPLAIDTRPFIRENRFIGNYSTYKGYISNSVNACGSCDLNGDGYDEFCFSLFAGHSCQPRRMCAYDVHNDTLYQSGTYGSGLLQPTGFDMDGDGFMEFTGNVNAFGNCKTEIPFRDDRAWLMVFDHTLELMFDPVEIGEFTSSLEIVPFKPGGICYLAALHKYRGTADDPSEVMLFDLRGNLIHRKEIRGTCQIDELHFTSLNHEHGDHLFLIYPEGDVLELDSALQTVRSERITGIRSGHPEIIDVDQDGTAEYLFKGSNLEEIIVRGDDFEKAGKIKAIDNRHIEQIAVITSVGQNPQLFIQCKDQSYYFDVFQDRMYRLRYLTFFLAFVVITAIVALILGLQSYYIHQSYERSRKISELQIRAVKNQVDPHFALNILNSIGNLFLQKDTDKADYVFGKYARMLRNTIASSDKISITLGEELENVGHYLDLEKYRMNDKFDYHVITGEGVNLTMMVPKMLIHTFAENAVKHGIRHMEGHGIIQITVRSENNQCMIEVIDNGVGRKKASEFSQLSTGKGLNILDEILILYRKLEKVRITYRIEDALNESGLAQGTRALITIPCAKK